MSNRDNVDLPGPDRSRAELQANIDRLEDGVQEMLNANIHLRDAIEVAIDMLHEEGNSREEVRMHLQEKIDEL